MQLTACVVCACACREDSWDNGVTFVLIALVVVYGYHVLLLFFGVVHCIGLLCGEQHRSRCWEVHFPLHAA